MDRPVSFHNTPHAVSDTDPIPDHYDPERGKKLAMIEQQMLTRYLEIKTRRFPASGGVSSRFDYAWPKMALQVYNLGADPEAWIDAQCEGLAFLPYPNQFYGEAAQQKYEDLAQSIQTTPEAAVWTHQFYVECFRDRVGMSEGEIFLDPDLDLRAWFRVLFCPEYLLPQIQRQYEKIAKSQLHQDKRLQDHLKQKYGDRTLRLIPQTISAEPFGSHPPLPPPPADTRRFKDWL